MATQVALEDQNGNLLHRAKLSDTAQVAQLLPALITTLRLPITDDAGRTMTYHLIHNDTRLQGEQTLASAEVHDGDTLVIVPEMTAGAHFEMPGSPVSELLVILEPTIALLVDPFSDDWSVFTWEKNCTSRSARANKE